MVINVEFFGYGAGLVMVGWFFGMIISSAFNAVSSIKP